MINVVEQISARISTTTRALICIDGPAGAGKTTLADELLAVHADALVIHMDDLYAGWDEVFTDDLTRRLVTQIRDPFNIGAPIRYQRYDWHANRFADVIDVPDARLLIVEGVGAAQRAMREHAHISVFVDVEPEIGKTRVIDRDGDLSSGHIDDWQRQEQLHFALDRTREGVDVVLPASGSAPFGA